MNLVRFLLDAREMVFNHYKFGSPPLESRIVVLEEVIEVMAEEIEKLKEKQNG